MADASLIQPGDYVRISLVNNPAEHSDGEVFKILSDADPDKIRAVLKNGDSGTVIRVINSAQQIEKRIMAESQYSENKRSFGTQDMRQDGVIPKTVQAFLNSDGGYLYIGIQDTGSLDQRLIGLSRDFDLIRKDKKQIDTGKLCDLMEMAILSTLSRHLISDAEISSLVTVNFPKIRNVIIAEIVIRKSPSPWFYKNLTGNNKDKQFHLSYNGKPAGDRILDDFYIRRGNSKKRLDTMQEFYKYVKARFINE